MVYNYLKLIHLLAVIMFLGNIITGLFWMHIAVKTKNLPIISHTMKGIIKSDQLFTIPGIVIITAGGIAAAVYGNLPLIRTGWILWGIILFSASGVAYGWKVGPLQRKIRDFSSQYDAVNFDWAKFKNLYTQWELWGLIALLTPLAAAVMMVLKIPK